MVVTGDEAFQRKSSARMQKFRDIGTTCVLVSHNMDTIKKMCTRAAWLDHGQIETVGETSEVIQANLQSQTELALTNEYDLMKMAG